MEERGRIVEHPVGTLKSRCGLYRFLMGGGGGMPGEFNLMRMAYNLTWALEVPGAQKLEGYCAGWPEVGRKKLLI